MANWTNEPQPFGANRAPLLAGWASDNSGPVPVAVDKTTGAILTSASSAILPTTLRNSQQTVTTSAVALSAGALSEGVVLESLSTNTVSIFVGGTGVTTSTGYELTPGSSIGVSISNTNKIFVICASSSPVVTWLGS